MTRTNQHDANGFRQLWNAHPALQDARLQTLRQEAFDAFAKAGLPTTRLESWKYTDIRKLADTYPEWLNNPASTEPAAEPELLNVPDAIHLSFIDGKFRPERSSPDLPSGLLVGPLEELANENSDLVMAQLGKLLGADASSLVALNTAFTDSIVTLDLKKGERLARPLYISHYSATGRTGSHPRLLVSLDADSEATIIEHFSGSAPAIINSVSELRCAIGASLHYYKIQEDDPGSWHLAQQSIRLDRKAAARTTIIDAGASLARNELTVDLAGDGATLNANGLLLASSNRHVDSRINVEHSAPNTESRERYRAILADKSRGVFNGRIMVKQSAQKTSAELTNRNLLLNRGAEIDTKPELEIYADDVRCSHGATTGQLDRNALFYLLARGIDKNEARNLLVRAFAAELLTGISIPAIAERTQKALHGLTFGDT